MPVVPNVEELLDLYRLQLGNPTSGVMFSTANGTPVALHNLYFDRIDPILYLCEQCGKSKKLLIAVIVGRRTKNTDGGKGWSYGTDGTHFVGGLRAIVLLIPYARQSAQVVKYRLTH